MSGIGIQPRELKAGHCVTGAELTIDAWTSDDAYLRDRAIEVCHRCPVLGLCAAWARSLEPSWRAGVVLGGIAWTNRGRSGNG